MNIIKTSIEGLVILEPRLFQDDRGYFFESFNQGEFESNVCQTTFVLEKVAEMDLKTLALNPKAEMETYILDKHYMRKHGPNAYYGQR